MSEKKFIPKKIVKTIDGFFKILDKLSVKHPYLVVLVLHEYYRILYSVDNHIPFKKKDPVSRINDSLKTLIEFSKLSLDIGSYNVGLKKNFFFKNNHLDQNVKDKTGNVYGPLWSVFNRKQNLEAKSLLLNRINKNIFKNKNVLDAGCGGGRYSYAISTLNAKKVTAVDYGNMGLAVAKKNYKGVKNLSFKKEDVLNLSFKDSSFDVVFSNGVIHHTTNLKKGIKEIVRVCKKGGKIWLYLYSVGGVFWYSRKLMNKLMKKIPYSLSFNLLQLIQMPKNRFIFMDNWYVPIEQHCSHKEVYKILNSLKVKNIKKITTKNKFDLEYSLKKYKKSNQIWGEGDIRLLIEK